MAVKDPYIEKAYRQVVKLSADEMARLEYEAREKAERDHDAYLKSSWLDGRKDGIEIGRISGIEIGRKSGIEIGRRDGILFGMRISACIQNSRQEGLSDRQIVERLSERFSLKKEDAEEYVRGMELSDV